MFLAQSRNWRSRPSDQAAADPQSINRMSSIAPVVAVSTDVQYRFKRAHIADETCKMAAAVWLKRASKISHRIGCLAVQPGCRDEPSDVLFMLFFSKHISTCIHRILSGI